MNLLEMKDITEMLDDVVEAIHHILKIEVTIIDSDYNRIAGTGRYACEVGGKVSEGSIFSEAIKNKQSFIVEQPGQSIICNACENRGKCSETAQVCCPILLEDEVVGVIGLVAFDLEQKSQIVENRAHLLSFLESMAGLIALKVKELQQANELQILTDCIEDSLLSVDGRGHIIRTNRKAKRLDPRLSEIESGSLDALTFGALFDAGSEKRLLAGEKQFQLVHHAKGQQSLYDVKVNTVDFSGRRVKFVVSLKPVNEVISTSNRWLQDHLTTGFESILGDHPLMVQAVELAKRTAISGSTILIQGESGTGKEMFARAIHSSSLRSKEVFLPINCAAIPEPLLESELFGYEEGAFTGSSKGGRIGKFEQAHKGTLFLDEIGDLPLHIQAKLLRVLQDGSFYRVGGKQEIRVDIRLVTATNRDLERMVQDGEFREDLFYRINVIPLWTPPLRDRTSDIPLLAHAFIKKYNERLGKSIDGVEPSGMQALMTYHWPGNVRELENAIEYAVNFCNHQMIGQMDLPRRVRDFKASVRVEAEEKVTSTSPSLNQSKALSNLDLGNQYSNQQIQRFKTLDQIERETIQAALSFYGQDQQGIEQVCKVLAISRATLYRKTRHYKESQNETKSQNEIL